MIKRNIFGFLLLLILVSCEDQLDIIPKGKSTLDNLDDLELLLNQEYSLGIKPAADLGMICNESLGLMLSVPEALSLTNTLDYAYLTYNEEVDRVTLTQSDRRYSAAYSYINYMNVILSKIDDVSGDVDRKASLKAEAHIIRAYLHWLLVNIYAAQYDAATAKNKGGIAYVDNIDVVEQKTKLTLEETYQRILEDCSDEIIDQLPIDNSNILRADRAFGNAVRAKVLMQMKQYEEALPYALEALSLNGAIEDRKIIAETGVWDLQEDVSNNYVYMRSESRVSPTTETLSVESSAMFENGDYVINYDGGWSDLYGMIFAGISGCKIYFGWNTKSNEYGISSDRMYYTAAECYIRTGEIRKGLELVDHIRAYRVEDYQSFVALFDQSPLSETEAMSLLQKAKWIECVASYENFFDCKRWNTEENYKRTIVRNLGDEYGSYSISPESPLWILPFPANATRYNSSLTQNF
nr:RagB/SusD family nutrient uptake outer membrane protein [uncultured Draconibacterium sp.]